MESRWYVLDAVMQNFGDLVESTETFRCENCSGDVDGILVGSSFLNRWVWKAGGYVLVHRVCGMWSAKLCEKCRDERQNS